MKMMNRELTDLQRVAVAKLEYQLLEPGQMVRLEGTIFGQVLRHIYTNHGFQMFVIENRPGQEYTLLFKGSSGLIKGTPRTWTDDWLSTNLPIGWSFLFQKGQVPDQLVEAARLLNEVLRQRPGAKFYLYGHSLGSINLQYALSHCNHIGQVKRVDLYEGPNIFALFNHREQHHVRKFKHKVYNYVDIYDPITVGYFDRRHMVGKLCYIQSKLYPPITQHMWGGYQFDARGRLLTQAVNETFFKRAEFDQRWMSSGHAFYSKSQGWRRHQEDQLDRFSNRLLQVMANYGQKTRAEGFFSNNWLK